MMDQEDKEIKRILRVDFGELEASFTNAAYELDYYLDMETGEVLLVTDEANRELENLYDEGVIEPKVEIPDTEEFLEEYDLKDWQWDMIKIAKRVEDGYGTRYIAVPKADSHEGYRDMEDFAFTVKDELLQTRLLQALDRKRPFRQFKDVLLNYPQERERWFAFEHDRIMRRILEWLDCVGIEPVMD